VALAAVAITPAWAAQAALALPAVVAAAVVVE